ncbi:MAG: electron transfer flavoprotein subunit alpha/FixB family protein, partial [Woeseiaceae bacterium]
MSRVLLIAEHDGTSINQSTAKCVACATELPGAEVHVAVFADDGATLAAEAAHLTSVAKVL